MGGEALLLMGESGVGKTSLIRAISGLWKRGSGSVACPGAGSKDMMKFVPYRSYLPVGTLTELVCYPYADCGSDDTKVSMDAIKPPAVELAVVSALRRARLGYLA